MPIATPEFRDAPIVRALSFIKRVFGFQNFRFGQREILEAILAGEDALIIMPTGGGKSLCYQVPAFLRSGIILVISPLIALMKDQVDSLRVLDLPVTAIHSLMRLKQQDEVLADIAAGKVKLVYVAPERLRSRYFIDTLKRNKVSMVAVDEAHCISQWGHDFRPAYLKIRQALERLGRPQVVALTATATERVRSDVIRQLGLRTPEQFITGFDRRNLFWEVLQTNNEKEKQRVISERLNRLSGATLIYTGTRKKVESIVSKLGQQNIKAEAYHAGLEEVERTSVQERFMEGRSDLVVATNAFGMGIDRSDIRMVIHHAFPGTMEAYYQEGGRAGRDGEPATCLLLYNASDRRLQEFFIEARYPARKTIFSVYKVLKQRPEDLVWLTYREIAGMCSERFSELAVASCVKILEDAGVVQRLNRYDNRAELFLHVTPQEFLTTLSPRAKNKRNLIRTLQHLYDEQELIDGVQFLCDDLAVRSDMSAGALRKQLAEIGASSKATYIPAFRGRGLRVCQRIDSSEVKIDFEVLQLRKAYELEKLDQVMAYAGSRNCRRAILLRYFGEQVKDGLCMACDRCREGGGNDRDSSQSEPVLAVKILSGIARLKGRFGKTMAAKVLTGSKDRMVFQFELQRLSTYGLLSEFTQDQVQEWIRELISKGCVASRRTTMGERIYAVLELTGYGQSVMKGKDIIHLSGVEKKVCEIPSLRPTKFRPQRDVFDRFRSLRLELAREEGLPAYCIFQDRTLQEMAAKLPETREALLDIVGVGEVTMRKYGSKFLELIKRVKSGQ